MDMQCAFRTEATSHSIAAHMVERKDALNRPLATLNAIILPSD